MTEANPPKQPEETFCLHCGYMLRHLTENRCPECGQPFNPADPRTMSIRRPLRPWQRWLLRPIGWPTIAMALLGTVGLVYLSDRPRFWPEPWSVLRDEFRWPSADLRPFTWPDILFFASVGLWAVFLCLSGMWKVCRLLAPRNARRRNIFGKVSRRQRAAIVFAMMLSVFCMIFGWQQRIGRRWMARVMGPFTITASWDGSIPASSGWPLFHLSLEDGHRICGNLAMDLPAPRERAEAIALLVNDVGVEALPTLLRAVDHESDTKLLAWDLRLIGLCRDPATARTLIERLHDPRPDIRAAAADAVGILRHPTYPIAGSTQFDLNGDGQTSNTWTPSVPLLSIGPRPSWSLWAIWRDARGAVNEPMLDVDPAARITLEKMMTGGATPQEREAAARTLVAWPPPSYTFRVAEWGVWINMDGQYALAKSILEEIPPFVHRTGNPIDSFDSYLPIYPEAVDKPIVHLTSSVPLAADLEVHIRQGRPWFAYPMPDDFEVSDVQERTSDKPIGTVGLKSSPATAPAVPDDLASPALNSLPDCREGYPWLEPRHRIRRISLGAPVAVYDLGLRWQSLIVCPERPAWMVPPTVPANPRFRWWTRLRDVPSSWIANRGEAEQFLYYDGPTRLPVPINATIQNVLRRVVFDEPSLAEKISTGWFADARKVFEPMKSMSPPTLPSREGLYIDFHAGVLSAQHMAVDANQSVELKPELPLRGEEVIQRLRQMLTEYGLTGPEAEGLIAAWTPQFFQTEGRRFVLRLSAADYDRQCPMQVRPAPTELVRLGLVLTEFDAKPTTRPAGER